jgi:diphosphomevalonate decarboxylase
MTNMLLSRYKIRSATSRISGNESFSISWQSPSNIALVKYWGKKEGQLPVSPSLSMTLNHAVTRTRVDVLFGETQKGVVSVNGDRAHPFLPKLIQLGKWFAGEIPVLNTMSFIVTTENSFPHSTGIASSASGISAFALCMTGITEEMLHSGASAAELYQFASFAARLGSGSACRSVYGGYTVWGERAGCKGSSDEYAIQVNNEVHPEMIMLRDAILVVSSQPKSMPSSLGHQAMSTHPFLNGRIKQAGLHLEEALGALAGNDFEKLSAVAECEALTLHALMMSAADGTLLMQPATVEIIQLVREARSHGLPVFFTLDAGANVHVMYPAGSAENVEEFIRDVLQPLCEAGRVIFDRCGDGPVQLEPNPAVI